MTEFSRIRSTALLVAAAAIMAVVALATFVGSSDAVQIKQRGTENLDGKVVMSPAAERVETLKSTGGDRIAPGDTVQRSIILFNRTDAPIDFDLDVAQVVGSDDELVVEVRHGVREGAAGWVELEVPTLQLKPGEQGTVGVKITIPDGIKPGSKPFAVTATQRPAQTETPAVGVAPMFKQVAIFVMELPGDAPVDGKLTAAAISSAQKNIEAAQDGTDPPRNARFYVSPKWTDTHRLTLSTQYQNDGERLLTPSGKVVVKDLFGRTAGTYDIPQFTVYPEGQSAGTVELKGLPSLGIYTASVVLESEDAGRQTTTLPRFVFIPKWLIAALAAFTVYGLYRLARWQLRRRREMKHYLELEQSPQAVKAAADTWDHDDDDHDDLDHDDLGHEDLDDEDDIEWRHASGI